MLAPDIGFRHVTLPFTDRSDKIRIYFLGTSSLAPVSALEYENSDLTFIFGPVYSSSWIHGEYIIQGISTNVLELASLVNSKLSLLLVFLISLFNSSFGSFLLIMPMYNSVRTVQIAL